MALEFTSAELVTLMREIQLFGETAQRARHATSNMLTLVPTHGVCIEASPELNVYSHSYPRTAPVGANLSGPLGTLTGDTWCGPVSFAPPAVTPVPNSGYDQLMASCVRLGPLFTSSVMVAQLMRPSGATAGVSTRWVPSFLGVRLVQARACVQISAHQVTRGMDRYAP